VSDVTGTQLGVDGHLTAWHGVKGEAGRDLGDALGALGDDDELHDGEDQKHHRADDDVAGHDEPAERIDDAACVGLQQDQPRRGDVESEPEQGGQQQERRKGREPQRLGDVEREQKQRDGQRDVRRQEQIHDPRGNGEHHQR